jgi:hypothetical protein
LSRAELALSEDAAPQPFPNALGSRRVTAFAALAVASYALALIVTLPAKVALGWADVADAGQATGTVWNGSVPLGPVTDATWRASPLQSLTHLALAADLSLSGADSSLTGKVAWRPGRLELDDLTGRAGWPLLAALAPKLPFACDLGFDVAMPEVVLAGKRSGAVGNLTSGGGACRIPGSAIAGPPVPALAVTATMDEQGSRASITPLARRLDHLVDATVTADGKLAIQIHPAATALLPAGAGVGAVTIETQL